MSVFNSLAKLWKGDQAFAKLLYVSYSDLQTPGFEFQRCDSVSAAQGGLYANENNRRKTK